jgi:hypothetical protein
MTSAPELFPGGRFVTCEFVAADVSGREARWLELADVLISLVTGRADQAARSLAQVLAAYPGCAVAAAADAGGRCLVTARGGCAVLLTTAGPAPSPWLCALACGSLAYAWLCASRPLTELGSVPVKVRLGPPPGLVSAPGYDDAWSCSRCRADDGSPGW